MKKYLLILLSLHTMLYADVKYLQNPADLFASSFSFDADVGYTSYVIDVTSTELNRAIDYNVLELRLGSSYSYGNWMWGLNGKILLDEQKSNLNSSSAILNDSANINRNEFSLFTNYKIDEELRVNVLYRYASLKSNDNYVAFKKYDTTFNYTTNGLATSLVYTPSMINGLFFSTGLAYSNADVEVYEKVNNTMDDVFIDDRSSSFSIKLGAGYYYAFTNDLILKLSTDWYKFDFGKLDVDSLSANKTLEQASLTEETYSLRLGMAYGF